MDTKNIDIDLETPAIATSIENKIIDKAILSDAHQHNINLDTLEDFGKENISEQIPVVSTKKIKEIPFWHDLDVRLKDIINPIIKNSEQPVIIVSDDKAVYFNGSAMQILDIVSPKHVIDTPFLNFVDKNDWNNLTSNIGEMLTNEKKQNINLRSTKGKLISVEFQAVYLPDSKHFSFILIGNHQHKPTSNLFNNLYDELTGLPNFFLFEDRVQMAINYENYKDNRQPSNLIAVAGIAIDNIEDFRKLHLEEFVIKKLANTLVLSLNKGFTVARGLKYPFWVLMPNIKNAYDLDFELKKLMAILNDGVSDNFNTHDLIVSVGVSVFPTPARSAKKLMEQSINAIKQAQNSPESSIVKFKL
ncbi:MAG: diguanylate cyclase [Alphaproteobacteria bacterium]|nr:diguanylate cyclase [Alphaproteobacteria bacterium]